VLDYRINMRFVDTHDQKSGSYDVPSGCHKWWHVLLWDVLAGAMVVNASVLYNATRKRGGKQLEHREYREQLIKSLLRRDGGDGERFSSRQRHVSVGGGAKSTDTTNEPLVLRVQQLEDELRQLRRHVMYATTEQGRCARRGCGARPRTACRGCRRWLCLDCFEQHHIEE
jgi:hypothetical protein